MFFGTSSTASSINSTLALEDEYAQTYSLVRDIYLQYFGANINTKYCFFGARPSEINQPTLTGWVTSMISIQLTSISPEPKDQRLISVINLLSCCASKMKTQSETMGGFKEFMATKPSKINGKKHAECQGKRRLFQPYSNSLPLDVTPGAGFLGWKICRPFFSRNLWVGISQQVLGLKFMSFLPKKSPWSSKYLRLGSSQGWRVYLKSSF